jgi:hypothetical protein
MIIPAGIDAATVLPTATHWPTATQDTPARLAEEMGTTGLVHTAPPLSEVNSTPCPDRELVTLVAVVPTTAHRAPATPTIGAVVVVVDVVGAVVVVVVGAVVVLGAAPGAAGGGGAVGAVVVVGTGRAPLPAVDPSIHETSFRYPSPDGVGTVAQVEPPSVVTTTWLVTWSPDGAVCAVTQQSLSSVQEMAVATDNPAGRAPSWLQPESGVVEVSATAPVAVVPMAVHLRSASQLTAVTSRMSAGTASRAQVAPPSSVPMTTACPADVWAAWPTAVQSRLVLQAMRDRYPTWGGMTWLDHVAPPSLDAITTAPFGAPPVPTVDPTAQHRSAVAQVTSVRELTGDGGTVASNAPIHGEPEATVEAEVPAPGDGVVLQAATVSARVDRATTRHACRRRRRACSDAAAEAAGLISAP